MIGVDFDNTIVCYDAVFGPVAVEQGLVPPEAATSKTAVRNHLRAIGREDRWTELQGAIYGPRMVDAPPFPGVVEFFMACRAAGIPVAIVSHRTRFPYLGVRHDLHTAARDWLARHGFHDPAGIGLPVERVFFEETKEAKIARISNVGCTHFIDDLPELLVDPLFPADVRRILFDPHGQHGSVCGVDPASSWRQIGRLLLPTPFLPEGADCTPDEGREMRQHVSEAPSRQDAAGGRAADETPPPACALLLAAAGLPSPTAVRRLPGGGNNRVYRVETAVGPVLLKEYFRHAGDPRDRLGAEEAFSRFAWEHGVRSIPQPLGCDREAGIAIHEFLPGRRLAPGEVTAIHVDEAAAFLAAVNRHRGDPAAASLPIASEACFSLREHLACVDRRLARLAAIEPESDLHRRAAAVVMKRLVPAWNRMRNAITAGGSAVEVPLAETDRVISPSDFGFHNCIVTPKGLAFVDFEYAGWDDPAKTVCDFFCQPAVPVPREHFERFMAAVAAATGGGTPLRDRVALLLPLYELKWCCIMLNEFLPVGDDRRAFAGGHESHDSRRLCQLLKVEAILGRLDA